MHQRLGDRYRLDRLLGDGGTGQVWLAHDDRLLRQVAVKVLHPWVAEDPDARERFWREATVMARLHHPNIVQVLDFNHADVGAAFLVQEFCSGGTLTELAADGPLPWARARAIAIPVARALAHAHAAGVVHRDLKPSNVLFDADGLVRVGDFGLARVVAGGEDTLTGHGWRIGSPEYWAPEQAAGQVVSERADIYSLGCVLFRLVTGEIPFPGPDRVSAGMRRLTEDAVAPSSIVPTLPREADVVIGTLLRRDARARPRASDVVRALTASEPSTPPQTRTSTISGGGDGRTMVMPAVSETRTETMIRPAPRPRAVAADRSGATVRAPRRAERDPILRPGVDPRWAVRSLGLMVFGAIASVVGIYASGAGRGRNGITVAFPATASRKTAIEVLVAHAGTAFIAVGVVLLAVWAIRSSGRARWLIVRGLLALAGIALAAVAAGSVVWVAHSIASGDVGTLIHRARG
jgi:serine/threonine protein kinase